jgi:nitrile hydratase beta subunit
MGGRFGDGPVVPEAEDVTFHADWHPRALALVLASGSLGKWNIDVSRHARECLAPKDYASFSYYEKWMGGLAALLIETGVLTRDELAEKSELEISDLATKRLTPDQVADVLTRGGPADRESTIAPIFKIGDAVLTRRIAENVLVSGGHTRLPSYAAGAQGRILKYHGTHVLPDSNAHGLGEAPEPLYAVIFPASELWQHPEHPRDEVVLDLWQSYLEAV